MLAALASLLCFGVFVTACVVAMIVLIKIAQK